MNLRDKEQIEKRIELHTDKILKLHERNLTAIQKNEWTIDRLKQEELENQVAILRWTLGDESIYGNPLVKSEKPKEFNISIVVYQMENKYSEEEINDMFVDWVESKGMYCGGSVKEVAKNFVPIPLKTFDGPFDPKEIKEETK